MSEIPPQARVDAMASVRIEADHTAAKNYSSRYCDPVFDIDWIKQAAFQCGAGLHGNVLQQLNR